MFIVSCLRRLFFSVNIQRFFFNEVDPITPDVGAGLADELSYGESVEVWLGFGDKSSNGKSNMISMY
jgi:hypothetical protein